MATPSYTTDLTDFEDFETANTISTEFVGYTDTSKGSSQDGDFPIQGSQHASAEQRTAATGSLGSDYGSNITWTSGDYFFMWGIFLAPNAVNTYAGAGIEMAVGASISDFYRWTVGGRDFGRYPYGGWQNFVVNPEITTGRTQTGSPATNYRWVGMLCDVTSAIAKGSPYGIDVIRWGRGELIVTGGEAGDYATFLGMATANDAATAKWGLFQDVSGSYLWKGLMTLGNAASAVTFADANRAIVIDNTRVVLSDFNRIEINNISSSVEWTNISFNALGTVAPGEFEVIDDATVAIDGCSFQNMGTFIFDSNCSVTNTTFNNCDIITANEGTFTGTKVLEANVAADTAGFVWDSTLNPETYLADMSFAMGVNNSHAIDFGTNVASNITLDGIEFTDYNQIEDDDGAALRFLATTGSINCNIQGCTVNGATATSSNLFKDDAAGIDVTLVFDPVTYTITVTDNNGNELEGASVYLAAEDNTGDLPFNESVSITRVGNVATVIHTDHGLNHNEYVNLNGITNETEDNYGCFKIAVSNSSAYTYTSNVSGTTTYTGDIRSTGVLLYAYSDVNGEVTGSRTLALDQNVKGYIRKSTDSPRFKSFDLAGNTIDSELGLNLNVRMVLDE